VPVTQIFLIILATYLHKIKSYNRNYSCYTRANVETQNSTLS